ncbi:MAG: hypothetical protein ACYC6M_09250 [Terriglobales bacterium]
MSSLAPAGVGRRAWRGFGALLLLGSVVGLGGCGRHRRVAVPPPVVIIQEPPIVLPPPATSATPPARVPPPRVVTGSVAAHKPKERKHASRSGEGRVAVAVDHQKKGSKPAPLTTVLSPEEVRALRSESAAWLARTHENLIQVGRNSLTGDEKATAAQAAEFARQASQALQQGDVARGHTLAQKALLLTQELLH